MKKLTIEEKARAYNEAIEKARERYNEEYTSTLERSTFAYVFPSLKESEGERIRKALIELIQGLYKGCCTEEARKERDMFLTWLEKIGEMGTNGNNREIPNSEQKAADKVEPKFKVGDKIVENNEFGMIGGEITDIDDTHYELDGGGIYIYLSPIKITINLLKSD